MFDWASIGTIGFLLIITGFAIIFIAAILLNFSSTKEKGEARGGGVVIIGFVPIIFGTDKKFVKTLLTLSIILIALLIIFMLLFHKNT